MVRQKAINLGSSSTSGTMALFAVASLLLTFFVALTAMSSRETERTRAVVDSFARRGAAAHMPLNVVPVGGDMPAVRSVERRWVELFPAEAASSSFGEGRVLRTTLAVDEAFAAGTAELLLPAAARLDQLARLLAEPPAGLDLGLEARIAIAPGSDIPLAALRARALLHRLTASGDGDIAAGVHRSGGETIDLELRLTRRTPPQSPGASAMSKPGG